MPTKLKPVDPTITAALKQFATFEKDQGRSGLILPSNYRLVPVTVAKDDTAVLGALTHLLVRDLLIGRNQELSKAHNRLLALMAYEYARHIGEHTPPARVPFALETGLGKTSSVVALAIALHQLCVDVSVTFVVNRVDDIADIYRDVTHNYAADKNQDGSLMFPELAKCDPIEPGYIGMVYNETAETKERVRQGVYPAPLSEEQAAKCRCLLVTHNRVFASQSTGADASKQSLFTEFNGRPRNLYAWDEALVRTEAKTVSMNDVDIQLDSFAKAVDDADRPEWAEGALSYLQDILGTLKAELGRQQATRDGTARTLDIPREPDAVIDARIKAVNRVVSRGKKGNVASVWALTRLLDLCRNEKLRVVNVGKGALITWAVNVPDAIARCVVLDGSYPLSLLSQRDKSLQPHPEFEKLRVGVKRYDSVTVTHIPAAAGKDRYVDMMAKAEWEDRLPSREAAAIINEDIPAGERVLIVTHKGDYAKEGKSRRWIDIPDILADDLRRHHGVDMSRVEILTWGAHRSTNAMKDIRYGIGLGMMFRPEDQIAAEAVAQSGDTFIALPDIELTDTGQYEITDRMYQAQSRGNGRNVTLDKNGQAQAGWFHWYQFLTYSRPFDILANHCPGLTVTAQPARFLTATDYVFSVDTVSEAIMSYLALTDLDTVSTKMLKSAVGMSECARITWQRAVKDAALLMSGWNHEGRSFVRCQK